jgi:putative tryptophan/tyrosine transport system substrate-binding protein
MTKKILLVALCSLLLALGFSAQAQQPNKIPRIGYMTGGDPSNPGPNVKAFRQGLRNLGYIEGKNILIEYRYAEGNLDRFPTLVTELVQLKVNVLVVTTLVGSVRPNRPPRPSPLSW